MPLIAAHLKSGATKSCGCKRRKNLHPKWNGIGDISGNYIDSIKRGAKSRSLDFTITKEYIWDLFLKQDRKCALSGVDIVINFQVSYGLKHTASLDRIDSTRGYIEGNVQWVHQDINYMKSNYTQKYFIDICKKIAKRN